jgi:hypothetical protein
VIPELDYPESEIAIEEAIDEQGSGQLRALVQPVSLPAAEEPARGRRVRGCVWPTRAEPVPEPLTPEMIRRVVQSRENVTRHCYNRALARDRTIAGRVTIQFVIDSRGRVPSAIVPENNADFALGICVAWAMKDLSFPATPGTGWYVVNYPFNFRVRPHERAYGEFEPH